MNARKVTSAGLVSLCALAGLLAFACSPALALRAHVFGASFGSKGTGAGQFEEPVGVAVSDVGGSAGEVYVADRNNNRVQIFNSTGTTVLGEFNGEASPTGKFEHPEWIAVDNSSNPLDPSTGDVYVTDAGHKAVDKFSATGTYEGQMTAGAEGAPFGELYGVAVDPNGVVWVYQSSREIDSYSDGANNEFLSSRTSEFGTSPGFAVDAQGHLFANRGEVKIAELDNAGNGLIVSMGEELASAVAVDPSTGDAYVDNLNSVAVFSPAPGCTLVHRCESSPANSSVEHFGSGHLVGGSGVAVSSTSGAVYVADRLANAVVVFPNVVLPDVANGQPTNVRGDGSLTLNGTVTPAGLPLSSCKFEYGLEASYGSSVPCEPTDAEIGSGTTAVPVSVHLAGLTPDTRYHYRLTATNENGENHSEDAQFTAPAPPIVEAETSSKVGASVATLSAQINPGGAPTTYDVEYGTSEQYGSSTHEVSLGDSMQAVSVQVQLSGLQVGSLYHFRFEARSTIGTVYGEDGTFSTTQSVAVLPLTLPDSRAYELVSLPDTEAYPPNYEHNPEVSPAGEFSGLGSKYRAAASGNTVAYMGDPPASGVTGSGATGSGDGNQYLAIRAAKGWEASDLELPAGGDEGLPQFRPFSADLSVWTLATEYPITSEPQGPAGCHGGNTLYSRTASGYHALILTSSALGQCSATSAGISADDSHILLYSQYAYTAGAKEGAVGAERAIYGKSNLYDSVGGDLHQVNILPDGKPEVHPDAIFGNPVSEDFGGVVAANGSRVFWTDRNTEVTSEGPAGTTRLFVRENDTQPQSPLGPKGECTTPEDACTVQVDATQGGSGAGGGGMFQTASADGSKVFFTDGATLTTGSKSVSGEPDLYEYDVNRGLLADLTLTRAGESANVLGVVGASEDGSYVYFAADGVLTPGSNAQGKEPTSGQPNLYLSHEGIVTFIATLASTDDHFEISAFGGSGNYSGDWEPEPGERTAEVTPDGHAVTFMSRLPLSGYDNTGCHVEGQVTCPEVFVYEADSQRIFCASCSPSGAAPVPAAEPWESERGGYLGMSGSASYALRWMNEAGTQVYFMTSQPLVPQDTNHYQDVYEWESGGSGGCRQSAGCINLLSSGSSQNAAYFVDASASGNDVFFTSRAQLVPRAIDETVKLYDARVEGGFPEVSLACAGTGCQGVPPAPPIFATPSSATFNGVGNFEAPAPGKIVTPRRRTAARVKAEKRAKALKACRKMPKKRRAKCQRRVRKQYGSATKKEGKR